MRAYEILLEYNLTSLIKTFGPALMAKWEKEGKPYANEIGEGTSEAILKWIEQYDPTQNKKYMTWILQRYAGKQGGINRLEDIPSRVAISLDEYERLSRKNKLKPEHKDINQIKSIVDLRSIVSEYRDESLTSKTEVSDEIEVVFDDDQHQVIIPKSLKASCDYGSEDWCTTHEDNFEDYSNEGPLYIILDKKTGEKWQWHFESRQYVDQEDSPIDIDNFLKTKKKIADAIIKHYGGLEKVIMMDQATWFKHIKNPSERVQVAAVEQGYLIQNFKNPSEQLKLAAVKFDGNAIQNFENPSEQIQLAAIIRNPYALVHLKNPSEQVQLAAVTQVGQKHVIDWIENPTERVIQAAKQ